MYHYHINNFKKDSDIKGYKSNNSDRSGQVRNNENITYHLVWFSFMVYQPSKVE